MLYKNRIKNNRQRYKLTNKKIAAFLDYSSPQSFDSSSAKDRILEGIDKIIAYIEQFNANKPQ